MLNAHKQDASAVTSICTNRTRQKRKKEARKQRETEEKRNCALLSGAQQVYAFRYVGCIPVV